MSLAALTRGVTVLTLAGLATWMAATLIGLGVGSVDTIVAMRTVLVLALLVLLTRWLVRREHATGGAAQVVRTLAVTAVVSGVLCPISWNGRALFGQILFDPGPATFAVDLLVWTAVVTGTAALSVRGRDVRPTTAAYGVQQT